MLRSYVAISNFLYRLRKDQAGVTAIEYGLIAGAIAVVIIGTVFAIGTDLNTNFTTIKTCLAASGCPAPAGN